MEDSLDLLSDGNTGCPTSSPRICLIVVDNGVEDSLDISSDGNTGCPTSLPPICLIVVANVVEDSLAVLSSTNALVPLTVTEVSVVLEGSCDTALDVLGDVPSTVVLGDLPSAGNAGCVTFLIQGGNNLYGSRDVSTTCFVPYTVSLSISSLHTSSIV